MAPKVLILGGVGFIGRNFVDYLLKNNLVDEIRVVDKVLPQTAYLSEKTKADFEDPKVTFKQANLSLPANVEKAFTREDGSQFDYVFNLAAETKFGQTEAVYDEKVYTVSINAANEAAKRKIPFVEVSTAQVYDPDKKPSKEDAKTKPWTLLAKSKLKAETDIKAISGLNGVILRPATVYGPEDTAGLTPRLIMGAVYRQLGEKMSLLWSKDLKINTVHVADVCKALWFVIVTKANKGGRDAPVSGIEVFNLADKQETDQGVINDRIKELFDIETGFHGTMISQFAKLNLDSVTEDVNEKHMDPWSELLKKGGISNTPLSPFLDKELLRDNSLSVDGSKIESIGFVYDHPNLTTESLKGVVDGYVESKLWPNGTTK